MYAKDYDSALEYLLKENNLSREDMLSTFYRVWYSFRNSRKYITHLSGECSCGECEILTILQDEGEMLDEVIICPSCYRDAALNERV